MFNTYEIESTHCPECDEVELVYIQSCGGIHCQHCGTWFDLAGNILETSNARNCLRCTPYHYHGDETE